MLGSTRNRGHYEGPVASTTPFVLSMSGCRANRAAIVLTTQIRLSDAFVTISRNGTGLEGNGASEEWTGRTRRDPS